MNEPQPPVVPADDRGLLLGDGLFETVRLYLGRPFRLTQHLDRLRDGARAVGIPVEASLERQVNDAVRNWGPLDGALRITLTRGSGAGLAPPQTPRSRLVISLRPLPRILPTLTAVIRGRVEERALVSGLKALGYLERVQAMRLAREAGADEALLRNSLGRLVEGSASNLFAVQEGMLVTPGIGDGALPGITRAVLLELAEEFGLGVEERGLEVEELPDTNELFLTSSLMELAAVTVVEGRVIGNGTPGPVFRSLSERFKDVVARELSLA